MTSELAPEQHPGVLSELNYFSPQFFQNNIVSEYTRTFLPQSAPTHDTPIEFHIESSSGVFLDLNDTDFEVRLRIVHRNGTALAAGEQCAPANQILHTMWKSVELYMNGTQVTEAHTLYPYLAYMSTLTNYGADVQTTRLLSAGWTKDTGNKFDINVSTDASENEGQLQRAKWFRESRWNTLIDKLNIDPFQQQLLIPGVTLFLRLIPHNPEFCLIAPPATPAAGAAPAIPAPDFRLDINRAVLRIPCKEINVNQLAAIQKLMLMKPILLPFGKRAIKHFTVGTGASSFGQDNAYIGTIPHRVTIMMVADTNFSGSYITNPFFFNHFDLSYLALNVNGEQIPRDPLQPDFTLATRDTTRAYFEVIKSMGDLAGGVAINLTPSEFAEGYTFFPLKLTPGPIKVHGLKSPSRHGSVRIELKFRNALPRNINVILLAEFDAYLRIDGAKNVTVE